MNEDRPQSPHHSGIRGALRIGGPLSAAIRLLFMITRFASSFASFGSFEPPRYRGNYRSQSPKPWKGAGVRRASTSHVPSRERIDDAQPVVVRSGIEILRIERGHTRFFAGRQQHAIPMREAEAGTKIGGDL